MKRNHARKGFTLIELLVVILILGILVAVALPAYLSSLKDSRTNTADTNGRAIATAIQSAYVKGGGVAYTGLNLTDATVLADLGGVIPTNPCTGTATTGDYTITVSGAGDTKVTIKAVEGTGKCNTTKTFSLGQ